MRTHLLRAISEVLLSGKRGALATVVRTQGSTPQKPGARLLLSPDGQWTGTLGGGAIELFVQGRLEEVRRTGVSEFVSRGLGPDLGMCCGGRMEIFLEPLEGQARLHLCGAGHVAQALAPLAEALDFDVTLIDDRDELLEDPRFSRRELTLNDPARYLRERALNELDWVLIATHSHELDERALEAALVQTPRYVGLVGSKRKVFRLLARIAQRRPELDLSRLYAPVGVALGAIDPAEIAVSIAAEWVAIKRGHQAPHLRAIDHPQLRKLLDGEAVPLQPIDSETPVAGATATTMERS